MKKLFFISGCLLLGVFCYAQTITQQLQKAFEQFESDPQLKHAISSLYVTEVNTGKVVFDKNSQIGLAPASTQKIITSVTAFELLGKEFRYKTELGYDGTIKNGILNGRLIIAGSGDPTLGSWRYKTTIDTVILEKWTDAVIRLGIKGFEAILVDEKNNSIQTIPDGWIWQDIGNYYGAGSGGLNWRENQYDIILSSGESIGSEVNIVATIPEYFKRQPYYIELKAAEKGTGDNAYNYLHQGYSFLSGTIPRGEKNFKISAAIAEPAKCVTSEFYGALGRKNIRSDKNVAAFDYVGEMPKRKTYEYNKITTHYSPSLDSIIYWFLKKSINLYGEALIKTFAYEKAGFGSTDSGVAIVKKFWKQKGLDEDELNIRDGSGLSPLNRVTTHAQVEILKYAKTKNWFPYFYDALPEYNGMKMKSGTISDAKAFCGYQKSKDGKEYIFSFIINNYNGPSSGVVNKMYKVLDLLK
jgi:D-alanyl-D-alanine carboxypeptidase/D-alanyl-D-alanine-endopeptidase (penicillin-binding protein 4)